MPTIGGNPICADREIESNLPLMILRQSKSDWLGEQSSAPGLLPEIGSAGTMGAVLQIPDCEFFSLQVDPIPAPRRSSRGKEIFMHSPTRFADFANTAAAISRLDLVISVDTATPTWLADWASSFGCSYPSAPIGGGCSNAEIVRAPTMRLFRQPRQGLNSVMLDLAGQSR